MATEKDVIQIEIEGGEKIAKAAKSISDYKKEIKEAKALALNGDGVAAKKVAELTDKLEDLNDETKSLKGSGVEKLNSSFGLLTDGFKNFDGGKIMTAFKGIGSAMKAIPLLLIVEGVRYLIENFDELSKGSGVVATALQWVGKAMDEVKKVVTDFTDAMGWSNTALQKQGEAIKNYSEKVNEALATQVAGFDRQIAVAKASGKSTVELEIAKQQAIIDTNLLIAKQIEAFVRAGGVLDDEKKKLLTASLEAIKNAKVSEFVITETDNKAKSAQYKKSLEEKEKIKVEQDAYNKKRNAEELTAEQLQEQAARDLDNKAMVNDEQLTQDELNAIKAAASAKETEDLIEKKKAENAINKQATLASLTATQEGLQGAQALSDIFFSIKSNKLKKGSVEEEALAKRQFEVNKKFQIANAVMQGAQAVLAAYSSGSAIPIIGAVAGPLYAAAAGLVALRNIAQIRATQFQGGAGSVGDMGGTVPSLPSNNVVPNINQNQQPVTTFTGNNNNNFNQPQTIKAIIVETDNRRATDRINKLTSESTF